MITPATLRKIFVENKTKGPKGITSVDAAGDNLEIDRTGLSRFRLHAKGANAGAGLVFTRDGLGWKLTSMRFPE